MSGPGSQNQVMQGVAPKQQMNFTTYESGFNMKQSQRNNDFNIGVQTATSAAGSAQRNQGGLIPGTQSQLIKQGQQPLNNGIYSNINQAKPQA